MIIKLYTCRKWVVSSISLCNHGQNSYSQSLNCLAEIKKQHDVTCMQSIEPYDTSLVHLLWARLTVPMAYLLNYATVDVSYNCHADSKSHRCLNTLRSILNSIYIHV